jgi:hypothetical protein
MAFVSIYHDDDKIQSRPHGGEVILDAQGDPLDKHLDGEEDGEGGVGPAQDVLQPRVLFQVNVLEAERDGRAEDEDQHGPFEERMFDDPQQEDARVTPVSPHYAGWISRATAATPTLPSFIHSSTSSAYHWRHSVLDRKGLMNGKRQ